MSLDAELRAFTSQKKFPEDPRICVPFIYTLLYIFDAGKISAEDFVASVYRKIDLDEAIESFFSLTARSLAVAFMKIKPEDLLSDPETGEKASDTTVFLDSFAESVKQADTEKQTEILDAIAVLKTAMDENDPEKTGAALSSLESLIESVPLLKESFVSLKNKIAQTGVVL